MHFWYWLALGKGDRSLLAAAAAPLVRWHDLLVCSDNKTAPSPLLAHDPADKLCTCASCFIRAAAAAPWERMARALALQTFNSVGIFFTVWTPLVYFGGRFWPLWWGLLLGILFAVSLVVYNNVALPLVRYSQASIVLTNLRTRMINRAAKLALASLLERARQDLLAPPAPNRSPREPAPELYTVLHAGFVAEWHESRGAAPPWIRFVAFLSPLGLLIGTVIFIASGTCVPLWIVLFACSNVWQVFNDLPVVNNQIHSVAALFADARRALGRLLAQAAELPPHPDRPATEARLRAHEGLLRACGEIDGLRATFVGVPVTWGLAKTFLVTALTLAIGLWSLLRGAGVSFTVQSVCPVQA